MALADRAAQQVLTLTFPHRQELFPSALYILVRICAVNVRRRRWLLADGVTSPYKTVISKLTVVRTVIRQFMWRVSLPTLSWPTKSSLKGRQPPPPPSLCCHCSNTGALGNAVTWYRLPANLRCSSTVRFRLAMITPESTTSNRDVFDKLIVFRWVSIFPALYGPETCVPNS